jgi:hypothetical protein
MPDFGIFRGFNEKLFGDKLYAGQLPTQLGIIGSQEVSDFIGLLDTFPNAAAAYSLRKLRAAYTGSAIEVRNDSGTHLDIGFVDGELDTSTLLTHCGSGNGTVSKWYDQSGSIPAINATQTTVANQPQIVSSGSVITENGKPSIQFDGIDDFFDIASSITSQPIYSFAVCQLNWTSGASVLFGKDVFTNTFLYGRRAGTGVWVLFAGVALADTVGDNLQNLHSVYANGLNSFYYLNGTQILNGNAGDGYEIDYLGKSGVQTLDGKSQEILLYNTNESSNRTGIEDNINDFYSIY